MFAQPRWCGELATRWGIGFRFVFSVIRDARKYDVIHVHYVWGVSPIAGIVAGRLWRRKVVMTPHESLTQFDTATSRTSLRRTQKKAVRRLLLRGVDLVVCASELELRDSALPKRVAGSVVPHPVVETSRVRPRPPAMPLRVGFLGRLHPKKNVDVLLEATAMLPPGVELLVGGSGDDATLQSLQSAADRLGIVDRVRWLGFLDTGARERFFDEIHVLAMPSRYECFGMVAAEAMSASVPVVVTTSSGVAPNVVAGDAGEVVPPGDAKKLADAIRGLLLPAGPSEALRERARLTAEAHYSFTAYGGRVRSLYDRI